MKRFNLFFLPFVTILLLTVMSGSFEVGQGTFYKVVDAKDAMITYREKQVKRSRQDHLPITESCISKKSEP
jgi:hypothetical protein